MKNEPVGLFGKNSQIILFFWVSFLMSAAIICFCCSIAASRCTMCKTHRGKRFKKGCNCVRTDLVSLRKYLSMNSFSRVYLILFSSHLFTFRLVYLTMFNSIWSNLTLLYLILFGFVRFLILNNSGQLFYLKVEWLQRLVLLQGETEIRRGKVINLRVTLMCQLSLFPYGF